MTVAVVSGIVILGGVGALIGSGLDENSFDPNTGEKDNGRDRATLLGGGISAAVSLAITIPLGFSF